jgi:hyperosmotically inducible periplasmic protein
MKNSSTRPRIWAGALATTLLLALSRPAMAQTSPPQTTTNWTGIRLLNSPTNAVYPSRVRAADQGLAREIKSRLRSDHFIPAYKVNVTSYEGVVTLSGSVGTLQAADRAAQLAQTIPGVRRVNNQITVVLPARSDQDIHDQIVAYFQHDPALNSYPQIKVQVKKGVALLSGSVNSDFRKYLAQLVAEGVPGVRAVQNALLVNHLAPRTDEQIQTDVANKIRWDPWLRDPQLTVEVSHGMVTLSGVVESLAAREHAIDDGHVDGTRTVNAHALRVMSYLQAHRGNPYFSASGTH